MAISIFPSTAAEFVSNNFVVDMNDTTNNTVTLQNVKQAGTYNISIESGDTTFDIYLLDSDGALVAYTNSTTVAAPGLFQIVVILGVADSEIISFSYAGNVNNTDARGDQPGAGAFLTSISPADLPGIDDTATVVGGNFGTATTIQFVSGATELEAKNIVLTNGTSLVVTRPDNLVEDDAPYDLRAINTGITPPTGSNAHILAGTVTAGSDPTWVTAPDLTAGTINVAYAGVTLEATDSDGTVVSYTITSGSLPTGLSLNTSTGAISGTPTGQGQNFTVTATDDGGNATPREFGIPVIAGSGGSVTTSLGGVIHTFDTTDDFVADVALDVSYVLVGGGGGGGDSAGSGAGGGGGGGGMISSFSADSGGFSPATVTAGTYTVTIGAGGSTNEFGNADDGGSTTFASFATAIGGGGGGRAFSNGSTGGAGGGGGSQSNARSTGNQGGDGGFSNGNTRGAGGGGGGINGGDGANTNSNTSGGTGGSGGTTNIRGTEETYAGGGRAGLGQGQKGLGGGGGNATTNNTNGRAGIAILRY